VQGARLEALRLDVMLGRAGEALPGIQELVDDARSGWQAAKEPAGGAEPRQVDSAGQLLVVALDILRQALAALERWEACVPVSEESIALLRALEADPGALVADHFHLANTLERLGRRGEALVLLRGCRKLLEERGDRRHLPPVLERMAHLEAERGHGPAALQFALEAGDGKQERGTAVDLAVSHDALANRLSEAGRPEPALAHRAAALAHALLAGHQPLLQGVVNNLTRHRKRVLDAGNPFVLPSLEELVRDLSFSGLGRLLRDQEVAMSDVQTQIDNLMGQIGAIQGGSGAR
jgi:hypothetical protein